MIEKQFKTINFTLNGKRVSTSVDVRESLSDMLRDDFGLTSVKKGCEVGECGACTVLVNGEVFASCIFLAIWVDGKDVLTVEGLVDVDGNISDIQQAFIDETAVQCGFCTPGFIMSAEHLLRTGKRYTRDELRKELAGNMCRCTGYQNIINAVEKAMNARLAKAGKE
ncbi:MAG: (2Fe-2S)-binding protein [Clostridiaceae bacterium]|jgi:carbon-monoxide dehydrogenase small subunit|nr:(2Fe-2S)-binding protein [Clostridia bacterium]MBP6161826.1 (2Fe-2S)-binding protein [Clostridia bacterium]MBP6949615.1 (2Fe-2S)-binding protein [Clostridia bacterium]NMA35915.1 (2Fe-2S)-binding protein [Clostridiaceae bacterium]